MQVILQDFSGGLNTRLDPRLLPINMAQTYININNERGALIPLKSNTVTQLAVDKYFTYYNAESTFISRAEYTTYLEYKNIMYYTSEGKLKKTQSGISSDVCIEKPGGVGISLSDGVFTGLYSFSFCYYNSTKDLYSTAWASEVEEYTNARQIDITINTNNIELGFEDYDKLIIIASHYEYINDVKIITKTEVARVDASISYIELTAISTTAAPDVKENFYKNYISVSLGTINYPNGTYTYRCTNYDINTDIESAPSDTVQTTISDNSIIISFNSPIPSNATHRRLYRLGGNLTQYTLIAEVDGTVSEVEDTFSDVDLADNEVLDSFNNYEPAVDLKYLMEAYAMFFAVYEDKLYYSEIAKPYAWPATNYIDFDDTITGIAKIRNILLVFTEYKAYVITGTTHETFTVDTFSNTQGCLSHDTIAEVDNKLLWVSHAGICATDGSSINVITQNFLGKLTFDLPVVQAVVYNNMYFLLLSDKIIVVDFRYNTLIREIKLDNMPIRLGYYKDQLYANININLYTMFTSEQDIEIEYKSPVLTFGKSSENKLVKEFYIKYKGNLQLTITTDNYQILYDRHISSTDITVLNGKLLAKYKTYGLIIHIKGICSVYEIEFNAEGRQK